MMTFLLPASAMGTSVRIKNALPSNKVKRLFLTVYSFYRIWKRQRCENSMRLFSKQGFLRKIYTITGNYLKIEYYLVKAQIELLSRMLFFDVNVSFLG